MPFDNNKNDAIKGGFMETDTKSKAIKTKVLKITIQIFLTLTYIGYFVSLYKGNDRNVLMYTNYIIVIVCLSSSLFTKPGKESKVLYVITRLNCIIFGIWVIAMIAQLMM